METSLNRFLTGIYTGISRFLWRQRRARTALLIAVMVCIGTLTLHATAADQSVVPLATPSSGVCFNPALKANDFSRLGQDAYQSGRFGEARDCWRFARKFHQGKAAIDDQINQAQAEQALGLFPLACKTLLPLYSPTTPDCKALPQDDTAQGDTRRTAFLDQIQKQATTPEKLAGLRSFGNTLRGIGSLDLAEKVLSLDILKRLPDQASLSLDLGNTQRAMSEQAWDFYVRSGEQADLEIAVKRAKEALQHYEVAKAVAPSPPANATMVQQQAQLNQLSFWLEQQHALHCALTQTYNKDCPSNQLYQRAKANDRQSINQLLGEVQGQLTQFLLGAKPSRSLSTLLAQIEQLPANHTTLHLRLNLAQSLVAIGTIALPGVDTSQWKSQLEPWMQTTVELAQNDSREHAYALGYLGKWYQNAEQWKTAASWTQKALLQAQAIAAPEIAYEWQWQLGQIYNAQAKSQNKAKAQTDASLSGDRSPEANDAYKGAFETLQDLRTQLAASNPDTQLSFQKNIETIYREYVNLLLTDDEPNPEDLTTARQVIAALQAVEVENFLRQGCPENNLEEIDKIINNPADASKAASFYPIVLESDDGNTVRLEVILKLPGSPKAPQKQALLQQKQNKDATAKTKANSPDTEPDLSLKHYRTPPIKRAEFTKTIRELQRDLEEEYTFYSVKQNAYKVYQWLLAEAEQQGYLNGIDTLVFALDTRLRNIPLAALVYDPNLNNGDNQGYLIEKYAIAIAPRLNLQVAERFPAKSLNVLAFGLSEPPTVTFKGRLEKRFFPALPHVKAELESIKTVGQGKLAVFPLLDQQFTSSQFRQALNTTAIDILHLATHGEFSSRPEGTFILSADKQVINVNDLQQIFRDRNSQQATTIGLLILSACETATGDQRATLGISGVAVRAGARAAIASLWTLDDEVSVDFISRLYKKLINPKLTKVQALQAAQLELARVDGYRHPRYWAPYIFVGNWL